jgi:hypothetical protein
MLNSERISRILTRVIMGTYIKNGTIHLILINILTLREVEGET